MNIKLLVIACVGFLSPIFSWADIYIVTHAETPVQSISRRDLAAIYLLKKNYWGNNKTIIPLNLPAQSEARRQFTQAIFHRSPRMLGDYWNKMSFKGINPPLTQSSEQTALLFVKRIPGAICYITQQPHDKAVKVLLKIDTN